jgi:hypothetical protein
MLAKGCPGWKDWDVVDSNTDDLEKTFPMAKSMKALLEEVYMKRKTRYPDGPSSFSMSELDKAMEDLSKHLVEFSGMLAKKASRCHRRHEEGCQGFVGRAAEDVV